MYEGNDTAALRSIAHHQFTKSMQNLLGICAGIAADNKINDQEIYFLGTWLAEYPEVTKVWPGYLIADRIRETLKDGIITQEERNDILETITQLTSTPFTNTGPATPESPTLPLDDDPSIFFKNMSYCFTGRFLYGTRAKCERAVLSLGAMPVDNVSRKLNYLVIGTLIEPSWVNTTYGNKIINAVKHRDAGVEICIVSEKQWTDAITDTIRQS